MQQTLEPDSNVALAAKPIAPAMPLANSARAAWLECRGPVLLVLTYAAAAYLLQRALGIRGMMNPLLYAPLAGLLLAHCLFFGSILYAIIWMFRVKRDQSLFASLWRDARTRFLSAGALTRLVLLFGCVTICLSTCVCMKQTIPLIQPFAWDHAFMEWDRLLHAGRHPWELLHPLMAKPLLTSAMSVFYSEGWFYVMGAMLLWQIWSRDALLRRRFFYSFFLMWILLGTLGAILLSSAGPCYYARVTDLPDPYTPLMAYLTETNAHYHVFGEQVREMLWQAHQLGGLHQVAGISAMPSLHVAAAVLYALVGWKVSWRLGCLLTLFAVLVELGSVHLAWHYAIDGYVSASAVALIWLVTGRVLRRTTAPTPRASIAEAGAVASQ